MPRDFYGEDLTVPEDEGRFKKARPGDHTLCAFQCSECHSRNIRRRSLGNGIQDQAFDCQVIRATLDTFWSRAVGTVKNHLTEVRFQIRYGKALGYDPYPPLGPYPLGEDLGMKQAIGMETRATEKGKVSGSTVKHSTARKARGSHTNIWEASPVSGGDVTFSSQKRRYHATRCPTESKWFESFSLGFKIRIGDVTTQDRAYTAGVLAELLKMYEEEWHESSENMPLKDISAAMFLLVTCLGGMRGFEAVWTDLAGLRYDVCYMEDSEDYTGVGWPIVGRFKAEGGGTGCHVIPIAGTTKSGIRFFEWSQRFIRRLADGGHTTGWAFRREDGSRAVAADYRDNIFGKLESVQATRPDLIDPTLDVYDSYGVQRSGRRFFDTECQNQKVSEADIKAQCRWATERASGGRTVHRSMVSCYAEYRDMKPTLLRPSLAL